MSQSLATHCLPAAQVTAQQAILLTGLVGAKCAQQAQPLALLGQNASRVVQAAMRHLVLRSVLHVQLVSTTTILTA